MTCVGDKVLILKVFRFVVVQSRYASQVLARALTGMPEYRWENFGDRNRDASETVANVLFRITPTGVSISPTMAEQSSREERLKLIHQNLQEVLRPDIIEHVVLTEDRPLKIYWGMAKLDRRICCNS